MGCGNGAYVAAADRFPVDRAVGLDAAVGRDWSQIGAPMIVGSALALPFRAGSFDTVTCFETLEHVPDPERAMAELARVAARRVIVTVPNCLVTDGMKRSSLVYGHWTDDTHVNFFDADSLARQLESAGMSNVRVSEINQIDLDPLVREVLRLPAALRPVTRRALGRLGRRYRMTLLAVCDR